MSHRTSSTNSGAIEQQKTAAALEADSEELYEKRGMPIWIDPADSGEESIPGEAELLGTDWM